MGLSPKHRLFVEEYLATWNATEAYSRAYPKAKRDSARRLGSQLLTNVDIAAEIRLRIAERTMTADEVLVRLTEQARAEYSRYLMPNGTVNLALLIADGKAHLIKEIKITQWGTNVKFHDPHAAKELLGKHHRLFLDGPSGDENDPIHIKHIKEIRPSGDSSDDTASK